MKKIQLGGHGRSKIQGYALVDNEDFEKLKQYNWSISSKGYACKFRNKNKSPALMHRIILNAKKGQICDHINRNRLDNRRNNLRIVSFLQNALNSKLYSRNTSGFRGVHWHKQHKKWSAEIRIKKKLLWLGDYQNKKDAALAYNKAAIKYRKEFAIINKIKS